MTSVGAQESLNQQDEVLDDHARYQEISKSLNKTISLEVTDQPLSDVFELFSEKAGIPVWFDEFEVSLVGVRPSTPISFSMPEASARSMLQLLLREYDLTYEIKFGALIITTPEASESGTYLRTVVYDVSDLVDARTRARFDSYADIRDAADRIQLIQVITTCIADYSWDVVGGVGHIEPLVLGDQISLVITQTTARHEAIEQLINALRRQVLSRQPAVKAEIDEGNAKPQAAPEADTTRGRAGQADILVTRYIELALTDDVSAKNIVDFVREMTPQLDWASSEFVCTSIGNTLVVKHRAKAIVDVEHVLMESGFGLARMHVMRPEEQKIILRPAHVID